MAFKAGNFHVVLENIASSTNMKKLKLEGEFIDDKIVEEIGMLKSLTSLHIENGVVTVIDPVFSLLLLEELSIIACQKLFDESLRYLSQLMNIVTLKLKSPNFTDYIIDCIGPMVKSVDLSTCDISQKKLSELEERYLTKISLSDTKINGMEFKLKYISHLELRNCARLNDEYLSDMDTLAHLKSLDISGSKVTTSWLVKHFSPNITSLNLYKTNFEDSDFQAMRSLCNLRFLDIGYTSLTAASLDNFINLSSLRSLSLEGCKFRDEQISPFTCLTLLTAIDLSHTLIRGANFHVYFKDIPLKSFIAHHTDILLINFSGFTQVEYMDISSAPNFRRIFNGKKSTIITLKISMGEISVSDEYEFRSLISLRNLDIDSSTGNSLLGFLFVLTNLENLRISGETFFPRDKIFFHLSNLRTLETPKCIKMRNNMAHALSMMLNLQYLDLSHSSITDEVIPYLTHLSNLKILNLVGCASVSDKVLSTLPHVQILLSSWQYLKKLEWICNACDARHENERSFCSQCFAKRNSFDIKETSFNESNQTQKSEEEGVIVSNDNDNVWICGSCKTENQSDERTYCTQCFAKRNTSAPNIENTSLIKRVSHRDSKDKILIKRSQ